MEQMKIAAEKIVPIDFEAEELPREIRELRPVVFREETSYWAQTRTGVFLEMVSRQRRHWKIG